MQGTADSAYENQKLDCHADNAVSRLATIRNKFDHGHALSVSKILVPAHCHNSLTVCDKHHMHNIRALAIQTLPEQHIFLRLIDLDFLPYYFP